MSSQTGVQCRYAFIVRGGDYPRSILFRAIYGQNSEEGYFLQLYRRSGALMVNFVHLEGAELGTLLARFGCPDNRHIAQVRGGERLA